MEPLPAGVKAQAEDTYRDNPGAMVSVIDEKGIIRFASDSAMALFGYEQSQILGHHLHEFFTTLEAAHLMLVVHDAMLNGDSISTSRHVRMNFGGTKCMNGPARGIIDRQTGRAFALAIGRPCEPE